MFEYNDLTEGAHQRDGPAGMETVTRAREGGGGVGWRAKGRGEREKVEGGLGGGLYEAQ